MAHYIAELIEAARTSPLEQKAVAQERCAEAILELWKRRSTIPEKVRPLIELEPMLRTLAALDAEGDHPWYFRQMFERVKSDTGADDESKQWLALATELDSMARTLIRWVLRTATQRISSKTQPWMELAAAAAVDESVDAAILKALLKGDAKKAEDARTVALKYKLSLLEDFAAMATAFAKDLRAELPADEPEKDAGSAEAPGGEEANAAKGSGLE